MDPRVKTSTADLQVQFDAAKSAYDDMLKATAVLHEGTVLRGQLKARSGQQPVQNADAGLQSKLDRVLGAETPGRGGGGRGGPGGPPTLASLRLTLSRLEHQVENADAAPTAAQLEAIKTTAAAMPMLMQQWEDLKRTDLKALNQALEREHMAVLSLNTFRIDHDVEDQIEMSDDE